MKIKTYIIALVFGFFSFSMANYVSVIFNDGNMIFKKSSLVDETNSLPTKQIQKIVANDGMNDDQFGSSISIHGDFAFVGAQYDDNRKGSAYFYKYNGSTWEQQNKLIPKDSNDSQFGAAVANENDVAIVGAPFDFFGYGTAYFYKYDGTDFIEQGKIVSNDLSYPDNFGYSVSINKNIAVIGAPGKNSKTGVAYVFSYNGVNWQQITKLSPIDGQPNDRFGTSVSINGNVIVVGAPFAENRKGAAYVFKYDGSNWGSSYKLISSELSIEALYGMSVSTNGVDVIVGAPYDNSNEGTGSAFIFKDNGTDWVEHLKLKASDKVYEYGWEDKFGSRVYMNKNLTLVSAPGDFNGRGLVYMYSNGIEVAKLTEHNHIDDSNVRDNFGNSLAMSDELIMIGSYFDENNRGAAYIFSP